MELMIMPSMYPMGWSVIEKSKRENDDVSDPYDKHLSTMKIEWWNPVQALSVS